MGRCALRGRAKSPGFFRCFAYAAVKNSGTALVQLFCRLDLCRASSRAPQRAPPGLASSLLPPSAARRPPTTGRKKELHDELPNSTHGGGGGGLCLDAGRREEGGGEALLLCCFGFAALAFWLWLFGASFHSGSLSRRGTWGQKGALLQRHAFLNCKFLTT